MKMLLDTHILAWFHTESKRIDPQAWNLIMDKKNTIYYSPVSLWECEIKYTIHSDNFPLSANKLSYLCMASDMIFLPLQPEHIFSLSTLHYSETAPKPHKDPFDRMLICQAKTEGMKFITHDSLIPYYEEECVISI
jgi:PIN domain nuclease of toxin-antitoxin system